MCKERTRVNVKRKSKERTTKAFLHDIIAYIYVKS